MKPKLSSPYSPFIQHRKNYLSLDTLTVPPDTFNTFVQDCSECVKIDSQPRIRVRCASLNDSQIYAVVKAILGYTPAKGFESAKGENKKDNGIIVKFGSGKGDDARKAADKINTIIGQGQVVRADENNSCIGYTESGESYTFTTPVTSAAASASSGNSSLLSTLAVSKSSGSGSTTTYLLLAAAAIAVILIIKKKKKNG